LTKEIDSLTKGTSGEDVAVKKSKRARYVWNEASMNELLQQLRGQSSALALLLEALNASSIGRILAILETGEPTFRKVAEDSASIRAANPDEEYAESICDLRLSKDMDDSRSIYTLIGRGTGQTLNQPLTDQRRRVLVDLTESQENCLGSSSSREEGNFIESLENLQGNMKAPALAVGILSDGGSSVYVRGVRKHDCLTPATQVDRFGTVAAISIMMPTLLAVLIEQKLFRWSTTIVEALPKFAKYIHIDHRWTTLEMLCAHVSGIRTGLVFHNSQMWDSANQISSIEGRRRAAMAVLSEGRDALPGKEAFNTTMNLIILAFILEGRTSRSIEDLLKTQIFDPLEMYHTGVYRDGDRGIASPEKPTQPWGHEISSKTKQIMTWEPLEWTAACPASCRFLHCLVSSLPDLMAFANLHLQGALGLKTLLLSAASFKKLHTPFHGTNRTPGGWFESQNGKRLSIRGRYRGWCNNITIDRHKKEVYTFVANIDQKDGSWKKGSWDLEELCRNRSPNIPIHNPTK
jgi:CubicO group peptidase (beta-lactamase class C family)